MKKTRSFQMFATFLLLVFFVSPSSTWALTTFGKTNPQTSNQNSHPSPTPALHFSCNNDSECTSGAHCVQLNVTLGKRCYCQEGYYEESPLFCSGGTSVFAFHTLYLLISLIIVNLNFSFI
ncbi:hypothetical protein APICC_05704 [Apis cerana cerana]|uniref:EGF-like domain-containing protein n=1 Tax=Apis cerana cerana TaxID=94128 RepID=A0A2A3EK35_APICC|nr:hypothetical protein APICC_05704 [Apis cerana cerana]